MGVFHIVINGKISFVSDNILEMFLNRVTLSLLKLLFSVVVVIFFSFLKRPFPQLEQDEIRVLVFRDCDRKGKTLLFDSKAVKKDEKPQVFLCWKMSHQILIFEL